MHRLIIKARDGRNVAPETFLKHLPEMNIDDLLECSAYPAAPPVCEFTEGVEFDDRLKELFGALPLDRQVEKLTQLLEATNPGIHAVDTVARLSSVLNVSGLFKDLADGQAEAWAEAYRDEIVESQVRMWRAHLALMKQLLLTN